MYGRIVRAPSGVVTAPHAGIRVLGTRNRRQCWGSAKGRFKGAVGSEGPDQRISLVQRDDAFAGPSGKCTGHFCPCDISDTDDVGGSRNHYGSNLSGANLIHVAFDEATGIALVERHQFRPRSATITSGRGPAAPNFAASSFNRSSETGW